MDSISNGLIIFLAYCVGFTFTGKSPAQTPGSGRMLALVTTGIHALGAIVDIEADTAAGQTTIATFLGKRPTAVFCLVC